MRSTSCMRVKLTRNTDEIHIYGELGSGLPSASKKS
jgi:hypothetical protein